VDERGVFRIKNILPANDEGRNVIYRHAGDFFRGGMFISCPRPDYLTFAALQRVLKRAEKTASSGSA